MVTKEVLKEMDLLEAAGCLQCGRPFTEDRPAEKTVPCSNRTQGVRIHVPFHRKCRLLNARDRGVDLFLARLQHVLDDHPGMVKPR